MSTKNKEMIPVKTHEKLTEKQFWPSAHLLASMEKAFDRFFGHRLASLWGDRPMFDDSFVLNGLRMPILDMIDRDNELIVRAEIPGIKKDDVEISIADNILTIKGNTRSEVSEDKEDYYRHEISNNSFARSVNLPSSIIESKVVARLKDGVLEVTLPKSDSSKRRAIQIS